MSAIRRNFEQIWTQLRSQKPSRDNFLEEISLKGLRGIRELRVPLAFPVTVLAGPNGCGKSTILFALACAYKVPGASLREFTPASIFPDFRPKTEEPETGDITDARQSAEITFSYIARGERRSMRWARGKEKWNRSFFGMKKGSQPVRQIFLRTLANLSNPSELRSVLQLARRQHQVESVDASNIAFAQRILSFRYARLTVITGGLRTVLFAERGEDETGSHARYSEFHMSAGERALLRLSMKISKLADALVLIDEVEAGLHPHIQQLLMLELQRLSLRNQLQIVVTTHSPTVLDTVPPEARVFLERSPDNVVRKEAYRDIIQKALYGRSLNMLSILCEDEESEALVRGFFDYLGPKVDLLQNDVEIGRDTGKDQFVAHLETLGRMRLLNDMVFVLDGDGRAVGPRLEARAMEMGQPARIVYLPTNDPPEVWAWKILQDAPERYSDFFGLSAEGLKQKLVDISRLYAGATDKPSAIAKNQFGTLAQETSHTVAEIFRCVGRTEAATGKGEVFDIVSRISDIVSEWRAVTG
jgi:predicted ATPase